MPFLSGEKRNEKEHGKISSYYKIDLGRLDDGTGIANTLETQNAVYHKICYNKIDQNEYSQLLARVGRNHAVRLIHQVQQLFHTREQKRSLEKSHVFFVCERDSIGNLCAAGEFYSGSSINNQNVQKLTKSWGEVALAIGNLDYMHNYVLAMLVQMKYFIIKITFCNFLKILSIASYKDDATDQRKKVLLQTYAWRQIYKLPTPIR